MCIKRQRPAGIDSSPASNWASATRASGPLTSQRICWARASHLSLIHISEPTRRTPLYSSAASDVYKETASGGNRFVPRQQLGQCDARVGAADEPEDLLGARVAPVSYTHLRAHETDSSLFVGSVRCV